jgi:hypothetical protein
MRRRTKERRRRRREKEGGREEQRERERERDVELDGRKECLLTAHLGLQGVCRTVVCASRDISRATTETLGG